MPWKVGVKRSWCVLFALGLGLLGLACLPALGGFLLGGGLVAMWCGCRGGSPLDVLRALLRTEARLQALTDRLDGLEVPHLRIQTRRLKQALADAGLPGAETLVDVPVDVVTAVINGAIAPATRLTPMATQSRPPPNARSDMIAYITRSCTD